MSTRSTAASINTAFAVRQTFDLNILSTRVLPTPRQLQAEAPITEAQSGHVTGAREDIQRILLGTDRRLMVVIGPCSIHDVEAGHAYAARLAPLARELSDRLLVVMRVYFEKPRTSVGWKGLIMDPHLDGSHDITAGLRLARGFLREVLALGLPTATELLDPITPQYIADLICWSAIGARTTESQIHRQMASGLSMPLGFKNGTDGSIAAAINAIRAAGLSQTFMGISRDGMASAVTTHGNRFCHIVLRGGASGPNHSAADLHRTGDALAKAGLPRRILVDCSHDNSARQPQRQPELALEVVRRGRAAPEGVFGVMVESNLEAGSQPFPPAAGQTLRRGVSITDGCIGWEETDRLLRALHGLHSAAAGGK